jgi:hypothetical protein
VREKREKGESSSWRRTRDGRKEPEKKMGEAASKDQAVERETFERHGEAGRRVEGVD